MLATTLLSLAFASSALALPNVKRGSSCDISKAKMTLPSQQPTLAAPTSNPSYIAIAIGTQNYTCSNSGTYTYGISFGLHLAFSNLKACFQ